MYKHYSVHPYVIPYGSVRNTEIRTQLKFAVHIQHVPVLHAMTCTYMYVFCECCVCVTPSVSVAVMYRS